MSSLLIDSWTSRHFCDRTSEVVVKQGFVFELPWKIPSIGFRKISWIYQLPKKGYILSENMYFIPSSFVKPVLDRDRLNGTVFA